MASEASDQRPGFSDLLAELTDSDVVVEVVGGAGVRASELIAIGYHTNAESLFLFQATRR